MTIEHVEFRNPQPAPTERGYHYARQEGFEAIKPTKVENVGGALYADAGDGTSRPLHRFTWFGPVLEVREGSK